MVLNLRDILYINIFLKGKTNMNFDINKLKELKQSDDFELARNILISIKSHLQNNCNVENLGEYIKSFEHHRLLMRTKYICYTYLKLNNNKDENILNYIIKKASDKILFYFNDKYANINEVDMTNNCVAISFWIKDICDELSIPCKIIKLYPCFDEKAKIFGGCGFHYFNIVTIQNKNYLVDISYKQFFKKNTNFLEEIGVPYLCAPLAGTFMLMDENRKKLASELLENGFVELNKDSLKLYCDGFALSYRNGLYYKYFKNDFNTTYTSEHYINFLFGNDSQINYEPIECLGPLKCIKK